MAAYVLVQIETDDADLMARYREAAAPVVAQYGGRYIVRGGALQVLEGDWRPERLVVLEFGTSEQARRWWESDEYAAPKAMRQRAGRTQMLLIEGV
jgi:uncharacterized protein (DUF1330 family)